MEQLIALLATITVLLIGTIIGLYTFINKIATKFSEGLAQLGSRLDGSISTLHEKINLHVSSNSLHPRSTDVVSKDVCTEIQKTNAALLQAVRKQQEDLKSHNMRLDTKLDTLTAYNERLDIKVDKLLSKVCNE